MLPRALRLTDKPEVERFAWGRTTDGAVPPRPVMPAAVVTRMPAATAPRYEPAAAAIPHAAPAASTDAPPTPERLALVERDAFVKGYAQGERAGAEAMAQQGEAMLRRLAGTIDEVSALRNDLIRRTERELVNLALVIAERVLRREVALDRELLVTMARVAIDRLGERTSATIRLNPQDHAALMAGRDPEPAHSPVEIVADANVSRGGCLVRSDFGLMDLSLESQINEMSRSLLGQDDPRQGDAPASADVSVRV